MSIGFGFDGGEKEKGIRLNLEEVNKISKEYKKLKKYMKTNFYEIQSLSGDEKIISELLDKYGEDWLPLFFCIEWDLEEFIMDKEKLKLIIRNLELLVDNLKSEVYSDTDAYMPKYEEIAPYIGDYDEVFYDGDDDGYPD